MCGPTTQNQEASIFLLQYLRSFVYKRPTKLLIYNLDIMPPSDQLVALESLDPKEESAVPVPLTQHQRYYLSDGDLYVVVDLIVFTQGCPRAESFSF